MEIEDIEKGEEDIVIGKKIVEKGKNFKKMKMVGVVDEDMGIENGDKREEERKLKLINKVKGREGRKGRKRIGIIKNYKNENKVMRDIVRGDEEEF